LYPGSIANARCKFSFAAPNFPSLAYATQGHCVELVRKSFHRGLAETENAFCVLRFLDLECIIGGLRHERTGCAKERRATERLME
jgi:hypothetical protein